MNENKNKIKKNKSDFAHLQQEQFVSCKSLEAFFPLYWCLSTQSDIIGVIRL
jgi:hypothetical protein